MCKHSIKAIKTIPELSTSNLFKAEMTKLTADVKRVINQSAI